MYSKMVVGIVAILLWGLVPVAALAVNPNSTTLPNGGELTSEIQDPADEAEFKVPAASGPGGTIDVPIDGEVSVGQGVPDIGLIYVLDVSASTVQNACLGGTILDCEVSAIVTYQSQPNITSVKEMGLVIFADGSAAADMPGLLTTDPNNVITVAQSAFSDAGGGPAGVNQFTPISIGSSWTDFSQAMERIISVLGASTSGNNRVFFFSDGFGNREDATGGFAGQLADLAATGAQVDTFAVGPNVDCVSGAVGTLHEIADATGGKCFPVPDPSLLAESLPDLLSTTLENAQYQINGADAPTTCNPALPQDGPVTSDCDTTPNLGVGDYDVTLRADGSDENGSDSVTADIQIHLLQLTASPPTATNELSQDDSHTVFGQILGGTGPDRLINFSVSGQNAGPNGSETATPGGAAVSFDYTVPKSCNSLGTDTITVSTTIGGMVDSVDLLKHWVDTIAPVATCTETENPNGNNTPKANKINEDGFYILSATDNLTQDCAPLQIFVTDPVSGVVFGPFAVGTTIKFTQDAEATPEIKDIGGNKGNANHVDHHIILNGDPVVTAVDQSGNTSDPVTCLVPEPPK